MISVPARLAAAISVERVAMRKRVAWWRGLVHGRIWRIVYRGGNAAVRPAPSPSRPSPAQPAPPAQEVGPPEGIHPDAGAPDTTVPRALPTPPGETPAQVALGARIYQGQVGGAACAGFHGSDAKGTPVGLDLTSGKWQWGDGSLPAITRTIVDGVPKPKQYTGVMPPMGGTPLTPSQTSAVAAYVWALGHQGPR
jgi:cytochrome c